MSAVCHVALISGGLLVCHISFSRPTFDGQPLVFVELYFRVSQCEVVIIQFSLFH